MALGPRTSSAHSSRRSSAISRQDSSAGRRRQSKWRCARRDKDVGDAGHNEPVTIGNERRTQYSGCPLQSRPPKHTGSPDLADPNVVSPPTTTAQPMAVRVLDTVAHQPFVVSEIVGPTTPRLVLYFVPRLLVYFIESAKYTSSALISLRRSAFIAATAARRAWKRCCTAPSLTLSGSPVNSRFCSVSPPRNSRSLGAPYTSRAAQRDAPMRVTKRATVFDRWMAMIEGICNSAGQWGEPVALARHSAPELQSRSRCARGDKA